MKLDALAIGTHPDDVELSCGGTVALLVEQGYRVGIVHLTRGERGTRGTVKERQDEAKGYYLSERHYGMVQRSIPMPPGLDPHHAHASFRQGVLTVTVPRSEEQRARERRIEVKSG